MCGRTFILLIMFLNKGRVKGLFVGRELGDHGDWGSGWSLGKKNRSAIFIWNNVYSFLNSLNLPSSQLPFAPILAT